MPSGFAQQTPATPPLVAVAPSAEDAEETQEASPEDINRLLGSLGKNSGGPKNTGPTPPAPSSPSISIPSSAAQMAKDNPVLW